jgi:hypothetical protein
VCGLLAVPLLFRQEPEPAPMSSPTPAPTPRDLQPVVVGAINFFEESDEPDDPYALLLLDVVHRRFGIEEFADSLNRYDELMGILPYEAPLMRLFRRIADYNTPFQYWDLEEVSEDVDRLTIPALYCNQLDLPRDYQSALKHSFSLGGYMLTHTLLACIWVQENGCELPVSEDFIEDVYSANAALINDDGVVEDLELEAAAFLCLAGQGSLVDHIFVDRVIASQNYDWGWLFSSDKSGVSNWHPSVLALLFLLHMEYPSESYSPMLASESP